MSNLKFETENPNNWNSGKFNHFISTTNHRYYIYIKLNNKGFTFIEVLISLFIVSLVSMEFCMIVNMNNIWNPKNKKDIHAMDILKNETEHLTKEIKVKKLNYNKMVHIIHLNIVKYEI